MVGSCLCKNYKCLLLEHRDSGESGKFFLVSQCSREPVLQYTSEEGGVMDLDLGEIQQQLERAVGGDQRAMGR